MTLCHSFAALRQPLHSLSSKTAKIYQLSPRILSSYSRRSGNSAFRFQQAERGLLGGPPGGPSNLPCGGRCLSTSTASSALPEITPAIVGSVFVKDPNEPLPVADAAASSSKGSSTSSSTSTSSGSGSSERCGGPEPYVTVYEPSTGEAIGRTPNLGSAWVSAAVAVAAAAQREWARSSVLARSTLLLQWFKLLEERKEALAALITAEAGKPVPEGRQEAVYGASYVRWAAEAARQHNGLTIPAAAGSSKLQFTVKEPLGVCALITPFNFPLAMAARKAAAALAAGNACLLRPSEEAPLSALALAAAAREAGLPPGLLNALPSCRAGAAAFAAAVAAAPQVRLLSFTGSTAVGRQLYRQCADTVKRLQLELGGNAPFVVFADADINEAVLGLLASKLRCAGQACISPNRVYVHRSVFAEFTKKATKLFKDQTVGDPKTHGVAVGPLINHAAVDRVEQLVKDAVEKGAKLLLGGSRLEARRGVGPSKARGAPGAPQGTGVSGGPKGPWAAGGSFFEVTVMDCREMAADARVLREELFGPIVCLYEFEAEEEAAAKCNDSEAGLAAYFYTQSAGRAVRFAQLLQCGMVGVNTGTLSSCEVPFGGIKASGMGREGSALALDDYTSTKFVAIQTGL
ncbi:succinate-semialdehyde dehydrogenase, putative [Eimeria tenella]|uniref:Succinate-semialdehyde dehydrogenase, putative n=1 Tax=Eimeria tenella TaxID=5802 RepID=U6KWK3_EIMTE|nr:succinate-semialdehyde dehydrogenase, putative [Eimeria tenella]CDJ42497.1 succinate-semialdehyde dehydrogenase, putative [Eimeria tenella]|eukprot:XP_013233247.1 succinate-semialdehyde dehydrogenase, putative [Eimeria tenella]